MSQKYEKVLKKVFFGLIMAARIVLHQCVRHLFKQGTTLSMVSPSKLTPVFSIRTNNVPVISISRHFAATSDESSQSEDAPEGEVGKQIDPSKDRRNPIPVEVSMSYLKSKSMCFFKNIMYRPKC